MAPSLILSSNSTFNPLTLNLSNYLQLPDGKGLDPANSTFTQKVFVRSLLKPGATYALEQFTEKELVFPLYLSSVTNSGVVQLLEQVNQIINTPGATIQWQDTGLSQATTFDLLSGQVDVVYSYREQEKFWINCNLRIFAKPLGHTGSPRPYAAGSAVGPLLMISPYASSGVLAIGASTQAGVAGYGGQQQGPSSGVFYSGNPSLAGDVQSLLQISYAGPRSGNASQTGVVPYTAISLLPDPSYQPLITAPEFFFGGSIRGAADAVASTYARAISSYTPTFQLPAITNPVPVSWAGNHRLFAIARASTQTQTLTVVPNAITRGQTATVYPGDWQILDMGTLSFKASQAPNIVTDVLLNTVQGSTNVTLDVTAFVMLPDNSTWFFNPTTISPSEYGAPESLSGADFALSQAAYSNTIIVDDVLGDQFIYMNNEAFAPSPLGAAANANPITPWSRGLVPRPEPYRGLPIFAFLGVGQNGVPSTVVCASGAWANPQNLHTNAQINVLEQARYVLP